MADRTILAALLGLCGADVAAVVATVRNGEEPLRVIDALVDDGVPAAHLKMVAAGKQPETGVVGRRVEIAIGK